MDIPSNFPRDMNLLSNDDQWLSQVEITIKKASNAIQDIEVIETDEHRQKVFTILQQQDMRKFFVNVVKKMEETPNVMIDFVYDLLLRYPNELNESQIFSAFKLTIDFFCYQSENTEKLQKFYRTLFGKLKENQFFEQAAIIERVAVVIFPLPLDWPGSMCAQETKAMLSPEKQTKIDEILALQIELDWNE